ncbi:MAG: tRNA uridine-5-carboxymethylaminomethyl(34) synthesis GTPase MnmE, partial [Chloroflexota bacterium]
IAAIATPAGEGGIGIVRMSGPDASRIAGKIFRYGRSLKPIDIESLESHRLYYGGIVDPEDERHIDEVMLVRMLPPRSFTREEVVEISAHGGFVPVRQVLQLCLTHGARLAEPGEFTLRAFLNGRIDLSQAEAVAGVVSAQTSKSLELAVDELRGRLTERLAPARAALIESLAYLDAAADFPDDEIPEHDLEPSLLVARDALQEVLAAAQTGVLYREGIQIAIVGRPNVGKSSLLNALLGSERAIVTEIAGTTRDIIAESINLNGIPATLLDTAGITETEDVVERIGVERSEKAVEGSGVVLFMLDRSEPLQPGDTRVAQLLEPRLDDLDLVVAWNKCDLPPAQSNGRERPAWIDTAPSLEISTVTGAGLDSLRETLFEIVAGRQAESGEPALVTARQLDALRRALEATEAALAANGTGIPLDLLAVDVRTAVYAVGEITGEHISEAVLDEIFSRFCIGK